MIEKEKRKRGRPRNPGNILKPSNNGKKNMDTKFKKGHPGGPGRAEGSRNKATIALEQIGLANAVAVYEKLIDLALGRTTEGDINACRTILDRVCPVRKGYKINLGFDGPINTIQEVNAASKHVVSMAFEGKVSAEEAEYYGKLLEQRLKNIIDSDVMDKMDATVQKVGKLGK